MLREGRFENDGIVSNKIPPTPLEKRFSKEELRDRYEGPYRKEQAKQILLERRFQKDATQKRIEALQERLKEDTSRFVGSVEIESNNLTFQKNHLIKQLETNKQEKETLQKERQQRGFLTKLKYSLLKDPIKIKEDNLDKGHKEIEEKLQENESALDVLLTKRKTLQEEKDIAFQGKLDKVTSEHAEQKKTLLEKVKTLNRESKNAISHTVEALYRGELDISQLAKEANAVVVHAIPLDGWSMKNTSMNNTEVDVENLTAQEKTNILVTKQPDVSASILSAGEHVDGQEMFYPFGFILDGKVIASYEGDEGTYAEGDTRRRKAEYFSATLQKDTQERFRKIAKEPAKESIGGQYNESIVHQPVVKGILIDEEKLAKREDLGDSIREYFPQEEEETIRAKYTSTITGVAKGVPTSGPYVGKPVFRIERKRTAIEKALEYASKNHPEIPVYLRRKDGIYTQKGKKVTAEDIYV